YPALRWVPRALYTALEQLQIAFDSQFGKLLSALDLDQSKFQFYLVPKPLTSQCLGLLSGLKGFFKPQQILLSGKNTGQIPRALILLAKSAKRIFFKTGRRIRSIAINFANLVPFS
ncbi:MAG: hypothetical protein ACYSWP_06830, partial [Planctomycetota bacterium]